jgi:choline transporter-like protein 2/4/5
MLSNLLHITVLPIATAALVVGTWIYSIVISGLALSMKPGDATLTNIVDYSVSHDLVNVTVAVHDDDAMSIKWALFAFTVFMCLWTTQFILSTADLLIGLAVSRWYWNANQNGDKGVRCCNQGGTCTFPLNLWIWLRYHVGTVSFASFLVALLQFVRAIFEFLRRRMEAQTAAAATGASLIFRAVAAMVTCCLWCLERVLVLITESALIVTAIEGKGFCSAARRAVGLIAANTGRYFALSVVTRFMMFTFKLLIALLSTLGFWLYLWHVHEDVSNWMLPLAVVFAIAYLIATSFFHIFNVAATTVFLSFVMDEQNNGKESNFAPRAVRGLMASAAA